MTSGLRGGRLKWRTDAADADDADADAAHDEARQARSAIVAVVEGSLIAREYCAPLGSSDVRRRELTRDGMCNNNSSLGIVTAAGFSFG